jgi:hypothetical protein
VEGVVGVFEGSTTAEVVLVDSGFSVEDEANRSDWSGMEERMRELRRGVYGVCVSADAYLTACVRAVRPETARGVRWTAVEPFEAVEDDTDRANDRDEDDEFAS